MSTILFITGAAGAGKSTIARQVAEHFPKCLLIEVDQLREMMVKGLVTPEVGWTEEHVQQFQWVRSTAIYMAHLYTSQGIDVVIDDVSAPPNFVEQYTALFEKLAVHKVLLFPKAPALIKRLKNRAGVWDNILVEYVPEVYGYLGPMPKEGWIVLDSGEWTIEHTVHEVLSQIGKPVGNTES